MSAVSWFEAQNKPIRAHVQTVNEALFATCDIMSGHYEELPEVDRETVRARGTLGATYKSKISLQEIDACPAHVRIFKVASGLVSGG